MRIRFGQIILGGLLWIAAGSAAWAQFPDGPGKDLTIQLCGKCHDANVVTGYHMGTQGWTDMISQMIDHGAEGTDAQFSSVLAYLVKNFGPPGASTTVNVNKAPAKDLVAALEITAKEADSIVKYRDEKGPFKEIGDFKKVPDLDYKKIEAKKDKLAF
jgi:competence ComEA-like helix-hairpin-helix protein